MNAQPKDSLNIRRIFDYALTKSECYKNLEYLCTTIGHRLSGSENAALAVKYSERLMNKYGFDKVFLQEVMVPHWVRGAAETSYIQLSDKKKHETAICALGGSVATEPEGILAEVVEVKNFDELESLGRKNIEGKIVFFNRAMEDTHIETFPAYGRAVNQRGQGASEAAKYGAIGVIVRSMSHKVDKFPHAGTMSYADSVNQIPAAAISTYDANVLSDLLKTDEHLKFFMQLNCKTLADALSYNVIGEITGSEFPNEYIVVSGHLDSWDLGQGAHDDGAGCVQSIEVLRMFKNLEIRPKRTLRAVLFMNEENGLRGGLKYAELAKTGNEYHLAAIESDAGGFTPRGFSIDAPDSIIRKIQSWKYLLNEYGLNQISKGGSGADIGPLKKQGVCLIGFRPDSQRYFDYHHAASDTFDKVNKRELELGAASMAALIYLIDQYGLHE